MKTKRWLLLALFLGSMLLSAWLSPALSPGQSKAASGAPETVLLSTIQNAITLPLWEEDSLIYLPIIR
jgi:uncharacterized membrane protein YhdT